MKCKNDTHTAMYGISRIDDPVYRTYAWRVSLCRRGKRYVKNFPDKKWKTKVKALRAAKLFRDELIQQHPPISRKEFSDAKRRNNKTGITGVYTYSKSYELKDGTIKESWYWEANWPTERGESEHASFSVNEFGDALARQMAIRARSVGMSKLEGHFWASERGVAEQQTSQQTNSNGRNSLHVA